MCAWNPKRTKRNLSCIWFNYLQNAWRKDHQNLAVGHHGREQKERERIIGIISERGFDEAIEAGLRQLGGGELNDAALICAAATGKIDVRGDKD